MIKKVSAIILAAMTLTVMFSGCKKELKTLTVGVLTDVSSAPMYIAQKHGFFPDQIKLEKFSSAAERDAALQSGSIDGAISDVLGVAFSINGGFDVKITSRTEGSYQLMSSPNSGITELSQIEGKKVGLSPNTIIEYCVDLFANGKTVSKEVVREMPVRMEMLANDQLDLAGMPEPLASTAAEKGAHYVAGSQDLGLDISILLFSKEAIEKKSNEIAAFYKAYDKTCDFMNDRGSKKNIDDLKSMEIFPEEVNSDTFELPEYKKAVMNGRESFQACIDWMVAKELIENPISYDDAVTDKFVK